MVIIRRRRKQFTLSNLMPPRRVERIIRSPIRDVRPIRLARTVLERVRWTNEVAQALDVLVIKLRERIHISAPTATEDLVRLRSNNIKNDIQWTDARESIEDVECLFACRAHAFVRLQIDEVCACGM